MDLRTREDSRNPLLMGLGTVALAATSLALAMLPLTVKRLRR